MDCLIYYSIYLKDLYLLYSVFDHVTLSNTCIVETNRQELYSKFNQYVEL